MNNKGEEKKRFIAWALYDWGIGAKASIIATFIFPTYFIKQIAESETSGTTLWGNAIGIVGLFIALLGPLFGAIADRGGHRKALTLIFTFIGIVATACLWFVSPGPSHLDLALMLVVILTVSLEIANIFYNAMLPTLTDYNSIGRWSGWAWGIGYGGGVVSLILCLVLFILPEQPLFNLNLDESENIRATFVFAAIWTFIFSLPLLFFIPESPSLSPTLSASIRDGLKDLAENYKSLSKYREIVKFLIARMIYSDGLTTLFAFGGIYAAGTFHFTQGEVILFGISLNIISGIGAIGFAWVDDWIGGKNLILLSLLGLILSGIAIVFVDSLPAFWLLGMMIGIFIGPAQAASRSFLARITPMEMMNQCFGFYALSGKITTFIGPFAVAWVTYLTNSQRLGMSTIIIFLVIGALLMLRVKDTKVS